MRVQNTTRKTELACSTVIADRLFSRLKGLLGRENLAAGEALFIKPCNGVHTFGMRFPIDIIFLNKKNRVIYFKKNLLPNRMTPVYFRAAGVLELPAGSIESTMTSIGDEIEIV